MTARHEDQPLTWWTVRVVSSVLIAGAVELFDRALFGDDVIWWLCLLIGLVLGFGGWIVIAHHDNNDSD